MCIRDSANTANTRRNFTAKAVSINTITGTMYDGISEIFTNAPIDTKNNAENTSLNGIVITFATVALLDSATKTPAKNAPITTDKPKIPVSYTHLRAHETPEHLVCRL